MNILITGGAGLLGAAVVERLIAQGGHQITVFDVLRDPVRLSGVRGAITYVAGDVGNFSQVLDVTKQSNPEVIYHLGAMLGFACETDPGGAMRVNAMGSFHVLEAARLFGARQVMFASSVTTFALGLPERRMADTDPQNPINLYGVLKLLGEGLGRYYRNRHEIDFRAIRFASVVGPGNRVPGLATYTTEMIEAAIRGEAYAIQASEDSAVPIIHVADCARALSELSAAPQNRLSRFEYLVDGVKPAPNASELAAILRAAIPTADVSFAPNPDWQPYLDMYALPIEDCAARADWGWKPKYDYRRIVEDFLNA